MRAFNSARYIDDAVSSVLGQEYKGFIELLACYDEGSTDDTNRILEEVDKRQLSAERVFRVISHPHATPFRSLEIGISQARGEYVTFLDSDNLLPSGHIARMTAEAKKHGAEFLFCHAMLVDQLSVPLHKSLVSVPSIRKNRVRLLLGNYVDISTMMFTRAYINELNKVLMELADADFDYVYEDWLLAIVALATQRRMFVSGTWSLYRVHPSNLTYSEKKPSLKKALANRRREITTLIAVSKLDLKLTGAERLATAVRLLVSATSWARLAVEIRLDSQLAMSPSDGLVKMLRRVVTSLIKVATRA